MKWLRRRDVGDMTEENNEKRWYDSNGISEAHPHDPTIGAPYMKGRWTIDWSYKEKEKKKTTLEYKDFFKYLKPKTKV